MGKQRVIPRRRKGVKKDRSGRRDARPEPAAPPPPTEVAEPLWTAPARETMLFGIRPSPSRIRALIKRALKDRR